MQGLIDLLFPPACLGCGRVLPVEAFFCEGCDQQVSALPEQHCALCAEPGDHPDARCRRCTRRPPPFDRAWAPFVHDGPIAHAIHQLKYEDHPELTRPLCALVLSESQRYLQPGPDVVAAIPLHASRRQQRKFDQAELLAGELAKHLGVPRLPALERVRATQRQVGLAEPAREANVEGAFTVSSGARVEGRRVLLVDDVFTTGATARAAAQALKEAGAQRVEVLTVARAWTE